MGQGDEFSRIARIQQALERDAAAVRVGIGDDAAVLHVPSREQVWTVDACVEGVHFDGRLCGLDDAGYRALSGAVSDVAAMGAQPSAALLSLVLPAGLSDDELDLLIAGVAAASQDLGCPVSGGNLSSGAELSITHTVIGVAYDRPVLRSGARAGQHLYITGTPGRAALGLAALQQGLAAPPADCIERWRRPRARVDLAEAIASHASAAVDLSDGLLQDAGHLGEASGVQLVIDSQRLPREPAHARALEQLQLDALHLSLTGGEDYELLFTSSQDALPWATRIGSVQAGAAGVVVHDAQGVPLTVEGTGFDHFR